MEETDGQVCRIIDAIPTLVWSARQDGFADFFNLRWLEYTGLSAEEALGWGWKVAIHPDDLSQMLKVFENALICGRPFEAEGRFRRSDGEFRWFLFRVSPLCDESERLSDGTERILTLKTAGAQKMSTDRMNRVFVSSSTPFLALSAL
jgi:PAS domain S-box-containing protein